MPAAALRAYLATIDPVAERAVIALDAAVRAAGPDLDAAVKYRILMYTVGGDWGTWVCAIQAGRSRVSLKFLYGVLLDDPRGVLRKGSSVLMSWDVGVDESLDAKAVTAYVREAIGKHAEYKRAHAQVRAEARTVRPSRPAPKGPSARP